MNVPFGTRPPFVASSAVAVTPSDDTELSFNSLYVGGTGDVVIEQLDGTTVTYASFPVGYLYQAGVKVKAATSATDILALN